MSSHYATSPHLSPLSIFSLSTNTAFASKPDVTTLELQLCPHQTVLSVVVSASSIPSAIVSIIKRCRKPLALCQRRGMRVLRHLLGLLLCVCNWRILCLLGLILKCLLLLLL